ncbi:MAG: M28 family peptidase [Actinobacteria bacterium]|nr:M28 family peptidase [Actinomycetota bacterium]
MGSRRHLALAVALGCLALLTAAGGASAAGTRVSLSARLKPAGSDRVLVTGRVTPAPPAARVEVQAKRAGGWRPFVSGRLRHGAFRLTHRATATLVLRARAFAGRRLLGVSPVRTVRVGKHVPRPGSGGSSQGGPGAAGAPGGGGALPPPASDPLSAASLLATIESYSRLPNHLSATPDGYAAEDELQANLAAAGLTLGEQAFEFPRFAIEAVGLTAGTTTVPAAAIAPLLYSGKTLAGGVTATLFDAGNATATPSFTSGEVAGKIVVVSVTYEHNSKAVGLDPTIEAAVEDGAVGLVAVTQAVGDYPKWEDVNARRGTGPLPVLMVGKRSGEAVIAAAEAGQTGTLTLAAATSGVSCERDVWGELEGADPSRRVFVGTPLTSFTPSASEHGSGVAIALGLARHYASLPRSQRPESLVFIALGGHEIGWLGLQALLASSKGGWLREADAYVHLGSALGAPRAEEQPDGTIATAPEPDPTGRLHDSENPLLERGILEDFEAAGVPTPETPPHIASGGEQTNAYAAGIPTVSFSGASLFFHTAGDVPSTVDPTILAKDADAFRRAVDRITAIPAGALKAANAHAAQLGSEIDADKRAPVNPTLGAGGVLGSGGVGGPAATPVAACP